MITLKDLAGLGANCELGYKSTQVMTIRRDKRCIDKLLAPTPFYLE